MRKTNKRQKSGRSLKRIISGCLFVLLTGMLLCGCSEEDAETVNSGQAGSEAVPETESGQTLTEAGNNDTDIVPTINIEVTGTTASDPVDEEETDTDPGEEPRHAADSGQDEEAADPLTEEISDHNEEQIAAQENDSQPVSEELSGKPVGIVWLGDSLTQGSLGDMDDNLDNAPYVKLQGLCGDRAFVEGFGYYGFVSDDIFWRYGHDYTGGEAKNPEKVYVIWVGSNDFALAQDKSTVVPKVEAEIDKFVGDKISKYIVLSHLPRAESMPGDWYKEINAELKAHYKDRFLDITSCAGIPDGFLPDKVHLTQESYDNVAGAVYSKLLEMGYIR
ncbi:MAG: hypothetical protein K5770_00560 [Lachnospiraceae bacterium]|nr:hypothetical protein [Lachnospiraceae bacterium]